METMMRSTHKKSFWELAIRLVVICLFLSAVGCASTPVKNRVPSELTLQVGIKGVPRARFWADELPYKLLERLKTYTDDDLRKHYSGTYEKAHHYLAISGGGAKGAFGAGLLAGWTASGTRPEFTMVTGISTGALTAPFAFLGPDYDDVLKKVYTTTSTKDILKKRNILFAYFSDSMSDTRPLKKLIAKYITADVIGAQ